MASLILLHKGTLGYFMQISTKIRSFLVFTNRKFVFRGRYAKLAKHVLKLLITLGRVTLLLLVP